MISFKKLLTASLLLTAFLGLGAPLSAMKISLYDSIEQQALAEGEELNFCGQKLTSDELGDFLLQAGPEQCAKYTILSLGCCGLEDLPAELALLPNLLMIHLNGNQLSQDSLLRIPGGILYLSISFNQIHELSAKLVNQFPNLQLLALDYNFLNPQTLLNIPPNIKELWANNCHLQKIPDGFAQHFTDLQVLDLVSNTISPDTLLNLPDTVRKLEICWNKLERLPVGFAQHFTNLQELNLWHNNLTADVFDQLPPNLRELDLAENDIQQVPIKILKALADSQTIVHIRQPYPVGNKIEKQILVLRCAKRDKLAFFNPILKQRMADLRARNIAAKQNIQVLKDHINDKRNQLDNMLE